MINFRVEIEKYETNGEKTGWSYVFIPQEIATQIRANERRSFRVKGFIDETSVNGLSLIPVKEDGFILALNQTLRKALKKEVGAKIELKLAFDADFKIEMPEDLELCLAQEEDFLTTFLAQPKSHRNYYINWLNTAKTESTRTKRLILIVDAMAKKFDFGKMIRESKSNKS